MNRTLNSLVESCSDRDIAVYAEDYKGNFLVSLMYKIISYFEDSDEVRGAVLDFFMNELSFPPIELEDFINKVYCRNYLGDKDSQENVEEISYYKVISTLEIMNIENGGEDHLQSVIDLLNFAIGLEGRLFRVRKYKDKPGFARDYIINCFDSLGIGM